MLAAGPCRLQNPTRHRRSPVPPVAGQTLLLPSRRRQAPMHFVARAVFLPWSRRVSGTPEARKRSSEAPATPQDRKLPRRPLPPANRRAPAMDLQPCRRPPAEELISGLWRRCGDRAGRSRSRGAGRRNGRAKNAGTSRSSSDAENRARRVRLGSAVCAKPGADAHGMQHRVGRARGPAPDPAGCHIDAAIGRRIMAAWLWACWRQRTRWSARHCWRIGVSRFGHAP